MIPTPEPLDAPTKTIDAILPYRIWRIRRCQRVYRCRCRVEIYETDQGTVIVVTELEERPAISAVPEKLANTILKKFKLDPSKVIYLEHFDYPNGESFNFVEFKVSGKRLIHPFRSDLLFPMDVGDVYDLIRKPIPHWSDLL